MGDKNQEVQNRKSFIEDIGKVRPHKLFTTSGPGAILNFRYDSIMVLDPSLWENKGEVIDEPGLATYLGVSELRRPFALSGREWYYSEDGEDKSREREQQGGIAALPFPSYHICKKCGYLFDVSKVLEFNPILSGKVSYSGKPVETEYKYFIDNKIKKKGSLRYRDLYQAVYKSKGTICPECGAPEAYPAGYVAACENGHLQDFDWFGWLHEEVDNTKGQKHQMYVKQRRKSKGTEDFDFDREFFGKEADPESDYDDFDEAGRYVVCKTCKAYREIRDVTNYHGLKCLGKHPHLPGSPGVDCEESVQILRKDASNVYFPVTMSTVSIMPLFPEEEYNRLQYLDLMGELDAERVDPRKIEYYLKVNQVAEKLGDVSKVYRPGVKEIEYSVITQYDDFQGELVDKSKLNVVTVHSNGSNSGTSESGTGFKDYFSKVLRVRRMREIEALRGFTRIHSADSDEERPTKLIKFRSGEQSEDNEKKWLPAIELKGEGIFLELDRDKVQSWKNAEEVDLLSEIYRDHYEESVRNKDWDRSEERDAQYVLLHTLAHLLIRELSLHSGYTVSELKERIYSSEEMCGILIYTTTPDIAGTLGGLEELGEWDRFEPILRSALGKAKTCTSDPQCASKTPLIPTPRGTAGLNGAACHCCAIIPDIACENQNRMLDRALVVPLPGRGELAFFQNI